MLFVRPDHLGDVLLTLPAIAVTKRAMLGSRVSYAVPADVAAAPAHCPYVDDVYAIGFPPLNSSWSANSSGLLAAAHRLHGRFDVAVLTRPDDPWSGPLIAEARIPVRIGFDMPRTRRYLTHLLSMPESRHASSLATDAVSVMCPAATTAINRLPATPLFRPTADEQAEAEAILRSTGEAFPLLLHPGSSWPLKNWPAHRFGALATRIHRTHGTRPLVLGTPREHDLVNAVVASSGGCAVGLAGRLSLGGLAALQTRARVVVGTDSGPLQLAALMGSRTVALYGPADPAVFASPDRSRHLLVRVPLPCSPCGTLDHPPCGASRNPCCITAISVDAVSAAVDDVLARQIPEQPARRSGIPGTWPRMDVNQAARRVPSGRRGAGGVQQSSVTYGSQRRHLGSPQPRHA